MTVTMSTYIHRYIGLSSDVKPTGVPIGSIFWERDTDTNYTTYDGTNWTVYTKDAV